MEKKIEMSVLLQTRLAPDQFPLSKQIQIASDVAKLCAGRLAGSEYPSFEDQEKTIEEFYQRIDKTLAYLETIKPEQFAQYESKTVQFPWNPGHHLDGKTYLNLYAVPNFYFHLTTAYSILRSSGVELGKGDFLFELPWKKN